MLIWFNDHYTDNHHHHVILDENENVGVFDNKNRPKCARERKYTSNFVNSTKNNNDSSPNAEKENGTTISIKTNSKLCTCHGQEIVSNKYKVFEEKDKNRYKNDPKIKKWQPQVYKIAVKKHIILLKADSLWNIKLENKIDHDNNNITDQNNNVPFPVCQENEKHVIQYKL